MPRIQRWGNTKKAYSAKEVMKDQPVADAASSLAELQRLFFVRFLTARGKYEDAFNATQTWLDMHGFTYDELIVVKKAEGKVAHLTQESLLVDDFTAGHEQPKPYLKEVFVKELRGAGLPILVFPLGSRWADLMPRLRSESSRASCTDAPPPPK